MTLEQQIQVYDVPQAVVAGDDYQFVGTITTNGSTFNLTGYTVTASVYDERDPANKLQTDHAVTLTTAASGIVTITFTAAQSATFHTNPLSYDSGVAHIADFRCVSGSAAVVHSDPWRLFVRGKIT